MPDYRYDEGIESARLTTRFLQPDDAELLTGFFANPKAVEFLPAFGAATPLERAQGWIERQLTRYREQRYGLQALLDKRTGQFVGECGLLLQDVDGIQELEVGYHLMPEHWGKGYATESAKAFMDHARRKRLADSIISIIDVANIRSQRVAERNGLKPDKRTKWREFEVIIYRYRFE